MSIAAVTTAYELRITAYYDHLKSASITHFKVIRALISKRQPPAKASDIKPLISGFDTFP
ncbi:UNVERIFIED_ORG: hypothetical protein QOE_3268 [Clostridioides difficile F501]